MPREPVDGGPRIETRKGKIEHHEEEARRELRTRSPASPDNSKADASVTRAQSLSNEPRMRVPSAATAMTFAADPATTELGRNPQLRRHSPLGLLRGCTCEANDGQRLRPSLLSTDRLNRIRQDKAHNSPPPLKAKYVPTTASFEQLQQKRKTSAL